MSPAPALPRHERPDISRIGALSGAMILNAGVLLLLLIPLTIPMPPAPPIDTFEWIVPDVEIIPVLPDPPEPPVIPRARREPIPVQPVVVERVDPPVVEDATWAVPADPVVAPPVASEPATSSEPLAAATLQSIHSPLPRYPTIALRKRWEGVVVLNVLVGEDGRALKVEVERSSGRRELDASARSRVLKDWRFRPAMRDGVARKAWGRIDVEFTLGRG